MTTAIRPQNLQLPDQDRLMELVSHMNSSARTSFLRELIAALHKARDEDNFGPLSKTLEAWIGELDRS